MLVAVVYEQRTPHFLKRVSSVKLLMILRLSLKWLEGEDSLKVFGKMLQAIRRGMVTAVPFLRLCDAIKTLIKNIGFLDDLSSFPQFLSNINTNIYNRLLSLLSIQQNVNN